MPAYPDKWGPSTGKQVILKSDFVDLWEAIAEQPTVRLQPPLIYVDAASVKILATTECPAAMQFTSMPNILNPVVQVSGGLSDGNIRTVSADVTMAFGSSGLYGGQAEKASQWYAIFALADDADTDYELKAIPIMRVKSQTGKAVKCGLNITPATGINYAFTDNELAGGVLYFLSGVNAGLMRTISANDVDTDTRITYTVGDELTLTAGDWFIVLPPATNFRLVGTVYNDSGSDLVSFRRLGNVVYWQEAVTGGPGTTVGSNQELVAAICPLASTILYKANGSGTATLGHKDYNAGAWIVASATQGRGPVEFCLFFLDYSIGYGSTIGYEYQPGCGF